MELLVALAVILILISALIGVGSYVKTRADIDLTRGMLETLSTALAQYHSDFGKFPIVTDIDGDGDSVDGSGQPDYKVADLLADIDDDPTDALLPSISSGNLLVEDASSAALFYFLDKNPSSRAIVEGMANTLVTNKDDSGAVIQINIGGTIYDLPRYVDPWGMSIRYEYLDGTAFPVLTSAGPDKVFGTPDDITSK
jgi:type II secretory pathway pseudopilin PulG